MIWKEKSRIRFVQMDNFRALLGGWIRELCGVTEEMDERIADRVLWWFG